MKKRMRIRSNKSTFLFKSIEKSSDVQNKYLYFQLVQSSINKVFIAYFLFSTFCVTFSLGSCPTLFIAQSISPRQAATLDIYHTKSSISSAADCANYCGVHSRCLTALYNHDANMCSVSTTSFGNCSFSKQRYATFHLKTDGAEPLSVITCIDFCKLTNVNFKSEPKKEEISSKVLPIIPNIVTNNGENSITYGANKILTGVFENPLNSASKTAQVFSSKLLSLMPVIPVNYPVSPPLPTDVINEPFTLHGESFAQSIDGDLRQNNPSVYSTHGNATFLSPGYLNAPQHKQVLREIVGSHVKVGEPVINQPEEVLKFDPVNHQSKEQTREFLRTIQQLNWIQEKMVHLQEEKQQGKHPDHEEILHGEDLHLQQNPNILLTKMNPIFDRKIHFNAHPLYLQEIIQNAVNAQEATSKKQPNNHAKNLDATQTNHMHENVKLMGSSGSIKTITNGSDSKINSGGFIAVLPMFKGNLKSFNGKNHGSNFDAGIKQNVDDSVEKTLKGTTRQISPSKSSTTTTQMITSTNNSPKLKTADAGDLKFNVSSEPIVVNGKILSPKEKLELTRREQTSSTTTTTAVPWHPAGLIGESSLNEPEIIKTPSSRHRSSEEDEYFKSSLKRRGPTFDDDRGFLNTFIIHGISSIMNNRHDKKTANLTADTSNSLSITTTMATTVTGPIICFRSIAQQSLLHASFKTLENVTLNECRCICADTWINLIETTVFPIKAERCKSLQYNEKSGKCVINEADHNGKYDLIYDKNVDYYYVSCQIDQLLTTANRKCRAQQRSKTDPAEENLKTKINAGLYTVVTTKTPLATNLPIRLSTEITTTTSTTAKITTNSHKIEITTVHMAEKQLTTTGTTSTTQKIPFRTAKQKSIEKNGFDHSTTPTTKNTRIQYNRILKKEDVIEKSSNYYIDEAQIRGGKQVVNTNKIVNTKRNEATLLVFSKSTKSSSLSTTKNTVLINNTIFSTTTVPATTTTHFLKKAATTAAILQPKPTALKTTLKSSNQFLKVTIDKCFEIIDGFAMNYTAGGLEHDVTLEECECFCANSLLSERYAFQCTSATYYHKEKDCILNLSNRQLNPSIFVANPLQNESDSQITYLGLICNPMKAIEQHANQQCHDRISAHDAKSTTTLSTSAITSHSDDCFMELPNYVLEGTALAIETNVTVEECKCYCVDSENRYGSVCQSLQYYFNSQTCLLNKENRITNPDQFTYDQASNVMHSYFDYRCHVERIILSIYVEQVCQIATQLSINDLLKSKSPSLNIDEKSNKALSTHNFESGPKIIDEKGEASATLSQQHAKYKKKTLSTVKVVFNSEKTLNHMPTSTQLRTTTSLKKARTTKMESNSEESLEDETNAASIKHANRSNTHKSTSSSHAIKTSSPIKHRIDDVDYEDEDDDNVVADDDIHDNDGNIKNRKNDNQEVIEKQKEMIQKKEKKKEKRKEKSAIPELEEFDDSGEKNSSLSKLKSFNLVTQKSTIQPISKTIYSGDLEPRTRTSTVSSYLSTTENSTDIAEILSEETQKFQYPSVGPCQYSALYQTVFNGVRLIKRLMVSSPAQCFAACHAERCRSANMIQMESNLKYCELFRDSIVDFRRTDVLGFDRGAVHFDSIQCESSET